MKQLSKKQIKAIEQLQKAFDKCSALNLNYTCMNSTLTIANEFAKKEGEKIASKERTNGVYPFVAYILQSSKKPKNCVLSIENVNIDAGGW